MSALMRETAAVSPPPKQLPAGLREWPPSARIICDSFLDVSRIAVPHQKQG